MERCRGATLVAPNKLEIRDYPVPEIPSDGGLLAVERAGICGTDVKYFHGRLDLPLPIILGHEILGRVVKLGRAVFYRRKDVEDWIAMNVVPMDRAMSA